MFPDPQKIPDSGSVLQERFLTHPTTRQCLARLNHYTPTNRNLFVQAFVHTSFAHEHPKLALENYQRLEFLGDAFMGFYVADKLFNLFPDMAEGELSLMRSSLVCRESMEKWGIFLGLDQLLLLGKGTTCSPSLVCDVFEALIGSIHCDSGFPTTCRILDHFFAIYQKETGEKLFERQRGTSLDPKSHLQQCTLKLHGSLPEYRCEKTDEDSFQVDLWIAGRLLGRTHHSSKREAQKILAGKALKEKLYLLSDGS